MFETMLATAAFAAGFAAAWALRVGMRAQNADGRNGSMAALGIVGFGVALIGLTAWLEYRRDPDEVWLGAFLLAVAVAGFAVWVLIGRRR